MGINEVRTKYLNFYISRGHIQIDSSSLIPENDPTTLFTGSGMQPLLPYLLNEAHPKGKRLVDSQRCFRAIDIEEVGDNRHTTFFEMLGNWSLGDYFKNDQLKWLFEFLTDEIHLDPKKLYVTVFIGDEKNSIPRDQESAEIWKSLFSTKGVIASDIDIGTEKDGYEKGMRDGRIFYYDATKNWWSRKGTPDEMPHSEPGGPDSEVFYDFGTKHDVKYGRQCHPNCDCGRFVEIANSVFMQYIKNKDNSFSFLPKLNVDFGGGLERIAAAALDNNDIFLVAHLPIIKALEKLSNFKYEKESVKPFRVVSDHIKAAVFLIADGVLPGTTGREYILRRLLRRAIRFSDVLHIPFGKLAGISTLVIDEYKDRYPFLKEKNFIIQNVIANEEEKFRKTLVRGLKELTIYIHQKKISGENLFKLVTTYGFPLELILEEASTAGITDIDVRGFRELLKKHQELSRMSTVQKFKGGLSDTSSQTIRYHTAHHLLLKALQLVLGNHVKQRGSNITHERLRMDFSHDSKMSEEQKSEVERIVNEKIAECLPVLESGMSKIEAEKLNAQQEFGATYPEYVSIYSIGPKDASTNAPHFEDAFSIEFCGGPHVSNTHELGGTFKIIKEESVASGIRRIKAIIEPQ